MMAAKVVAKGTAEASAVMLASCGPISAETSPRLHQADHARLQRLGRDIGGGKAEEPCADI